LNGSEKIIDAKLRKPGRLVPVKILAGTIVPGFLTETTNFDTVNKIPLTQQEEQLWIKK
jgi:hypothetical protein